MNWRRAAALFGVFSVMIHLLTVQPAPDGPLPHPVPALPDLFGSFHRAFAALARPHTSPGNTDSQSTPISNCCFSADQSPAIIRRMCEEIDRAGPDARSPRSAPPAPRRTGRATRGERRGDAGQLGGCVAAAVQPGGRDVRRIGFEDDRISRQRSRHGTDARRAAESHRTAETQREAKLMNSSACRRLPLKAWAMPPRTR